MLNILAELGWHGLIIFVLVLSVFAWHAFKLAVKGVRPWLRAVGQGYLAALVGILAGGLTDHVYFNMDMGLLFWCVSMVMMQCSLLNRLSRSGRQKIALHTRDRHATIKSENFLIFMEGKNEF